jgi:hypothetical protein
VDIATGINDPTANGFNVYPNPASSQFHVTVDQPGASTVEVTGMDGKVIRVVQLAPGQHDVVMDMSGFAKGIYTVTLRGEQTVFRRITLL